MPKQHLKIASDSKLGGVINKATANVMKANKGKSTAVRSSFSVKPGKGKC